MSRRNPKMFDSRRNEFPVLKTLRRVKNGCVGFCRFSYARRSEKPLYWDNCSVISINRPKKELGSISGSETTVASSDGAGSLLLNS